MLRDAYLTITHFLQQGYCRFRSSRTLYCDPNVYFLIFQQITVPSSSESNSSRRVLDAEYEGIMIPQNVGHYPPATVSHPYKTLVCLAQVLCTNTTFTKVGYLIQSSASSFSSHTLSKKY